MKKLDELIKCLGTILVCYHEKQCGPVPGGTEAYTTKLLSAPNYEAQLKTLNAKAISIYARCEYLLQHLLDCIVYFKHIQAQKSFSPAEASTHKKNVAALLSDINHLLTLKQKEQHQVATPQKGAATNAFTLSKVTLSGCRIPGKISGFSLCFSGELIQAELFNQIIPPAKQNAQGFEAFSLETIEEHLKPVLMATASAQSTKLAQLEKETDGQKDEIAALKAALEKAQKAEQALKSQLDTATKTAAAREAGLNANVKQLTDEVSSLKVAKTQLEGRIPAAGFQGAFFGTMEQLNRARFNKPHLAQTESSHKLE